MLVVYSESIILSRVGSCNLLKDRLPPAPTSTPQHPSATPPATVHPSRHVFATVQMPHPADFDFVVSKLHHPSRRIEHDLHPGRLTWNIQITHLERKMIFQTSMIMFHVNLQGCNISKLVLDSIQQQNHQKNP